MTLKQKGLNEVDYISDIETLTEKQIKEIKAIYKVLSHSDYGEKLLEIESTETMKSREEMYKDYNRLRSIGKQDIAKKLEDHFTNAAVYNMRDGFVIGFMYALRLNGIS